MEPPQARDANCNLMNPFFPFFSKKERGLRATNISHTTLMGSLVPTSREMERGNRYHFATQVPADIKEVQWKSSDTELPKGNFSFLYISTTGMRQFEV